MAVTEPTEGGVMLSELLKLRGVKLSPIEFKLHPEGKLSMKKDDT
jgi:hypothetical protein